MELTQLNPKEKSRTYTFPNAEKIYALQEAYDSCDEIKGNLETAKE